MWPNITKLVVITSIVRITNSSSVGQYKSYWIPDTKWTKLNTGPSTAKTYGRYNALKFPMSRRI